MSNILTAIKAMIEYSSNVIAEASENNSLNRANQMGDALEDYVKNAFADCLGRDIRSVNQSRKTVFSYLGNSSNPPDAMLIGGDAIEIKKITALGTPRLQLNSSYPKNKLYASNPKICRACRDCENWQVKDMLYVVGQVNGKELQNIFFIYGDLYCDSHYIYENVENKIKESLESLEDVELADTKELGRVNKVDHLGITDLRIRGMWLIKTPFQYFDYLTEEIRDYAFKLVALIPEDKYKSFSNVEEFEKFCDEHSVMISDEEIEDPRNPADFINSKLIVYYY
ncbi:MAG: NgoPII family restriction endonuclease [Muribaculaceae bacterium]|nr:NgoPII family restriction endonuclease [Muribaculaceae bacterium]